MLLYVDNIYHRYKLPGGYKSMIYSIVCVCVCVCVCLSIAWERSLRPGARRREEVSAAPQNVLEVLKVAGPQRFRVPVHAARARAAEQPSSPEVLFITTNTRTRSASRRGVSLLILYLLDYYYTGY